MATLLLRTVEGRVLTSLEVDNNFSNLNIEIADVGNNLANAEGNIGIVTNLTTTATDNVVEAINEIEANVNALGSMSLQSNANVNIGGTGYIDISGGSPDTSLGRITASTIVSEGSLFLDNEGIDGFGILTYSSNIGGLNSGGNVEYLNENTSVQSYTSVTANIAFNQSGTALFDCPIILDNDFITPDANGNVTFSMQEQGNEVFIDGPGSNIFIDIAGADNTLPSGKVMYINVYVDNYGSNIYYPKGLTIGGLKSAFYGTEADMNITWEGGVVPSVPPGSDMLYTMRVRTYSGGFVVYGSSRVLDVV